MKTDYSSGASGASFCLALSNMFVPFFASPSHCYSIIGVSRAALLTMIFCVCTESVCRNHFWSQLQIPNLHLLVGHHGLHWSALTWLIWNHSGFVHMHTEQSASCTSEVLKSIPKGLKWSGWVLQVQVCSVALFKLECQHKELKCRKILTKPARQCLHQLWVTQNTFSCLICYEYFI